MAVKNTHKKVIAVMQARGRGSTIPKKNLYPLNGKPMLWHFLTEMKKADFIDAIGVWTECDQIAKMVQSCGCRPLFRPKGMVHYGSGFYTPEQWHECIDGETEKYFGKGPYIRVWLNCNYVLFRAESLTRMYTMFMEDKDADIVFPIYAIEPDLHMLNPRTGYLFPVLFGSEHLKREENQLYRRVGIHISLAGITPQSGPAKAIYLKIPWHEGKDIQEMEDVEFAEYVLEHREKDG